MSVLAAGHWDFEASGDGSDPSECDGKYTITHCVVALSTGWYNHGKYCHRHIQINAKGRSVLAKVAKATILVVTSQLNLVFKFLDHNKI